MTTPTPARRPRRWRKAALAGSILVLGLVAGLPWLVGSGPGRSIVADRLNRGLAPGRLEFRSLSVSWFGATRLEKCVLLDPQGTRVGSAPVASIDRTLGQWIFGASGTMTLDLGAAALDVRRSSDGTIDLGEALKTLIANPDPRRDLLVKINGGTLRYRDPFLAEPSTADALDLDLRIRPMPDPVSWKLRLAQGPESGLEIQGDFDRWLARGGPPRTPELQVSVVGRRWPFVARTAGVDASGRLDGSLDFLRRQGRWRLSGDARLLGFQARGSPLNGDTLAFDRLEAGWELAEGDEGWTIRRLSLTSPLGDLKAEGQLSGPEGAGRQRIEGRVDLAALTRQLPHALHLRDGLTVDRGTARLTIDAKGEAGRTAYDLEALVSDLAARDQDRALSLRDPATFSARLVREGGDSSLERLSVRTSFLDASARGKLAEGVDVAGTIDLAGLRKQVGDWVDLGTLDLSGRAEFSGTYKVGSPPIPAEHLGVSWIPPVLFHNEWKATVRDLRVEGVPAGPIRRDLATFRATSDGPATASGIPRGWDGLTVSARSGNTGASLSLQSRGGFQVLLDTPIGDRPFGAGLSGELAADRKSLGISNLSIELRPGKDQPPEAGVSVRARGRYDLENGELVLESAPPPRPRRPGEGDGVRVTGLGKGREALRAEGEFEGQAEDLDRLLSGLAGRPPLGLTGQWSAIANARGDADGVQLAGKIGLDDGTGLEGKPARPTSLAARAHYSTGLDRLDLSEFTVSTPYGTLDASGTIDDPAGLRRVDLKGIVAPDFAAINALLVRKVEPGARLEGKPRAFRASGTLGDSSGTLLQRLDAELGFEIAGADIYGMKFGPSPVVLRSRGGRLSVDPISTTLNEGHIRLEPEVDLDAPGGPVLRLAKNSAIREARINDEVSRRVLAFVAPILDQATRARGLVSVDLDHAEFPIGPGRGRQAKVEGAVVFEDVEFAPGPLANDLLTVIGRRDAALKLDRPVTLTIADGRVNQRGMSIPVGDLTRIEMAGWVDFDRNLAITATLPVTGAMLGNNPLLTDIASGTLVKLPIRGTLDRPVIDRDAMAANLQEMGKSLLTRGATRGAMELLMRLGRPRDPDAPPPPPRLTPQEKKAIRQEKKAIRRGEVPPPAAPDPGR